MSKKSWPPIRKGTNHGKTSFIVDARFNGKGERKFFPTKSKAEGWAHTQKVKRQNEGKSAFDDSELAAFGWTVQKATSFALAHLRAEQASVTVSEATLALVAQKKAGGRSEQYQKDLTHRLARVADHFDGKKLAAITTADLDAFLSSLTVAPGTKNTFRRDIRTLWGFAGKRGWALAATAKDTEAATVSQALPGILQPKQAATLLKKTTDPETLAFHAIGLFAGLRVSEIKALDWRDVDLPGGLITVSAQIAKTRSRRLVPILPSSSPHRRDACAPEGKPRGKVSRSQQIYRAGRGQITASSMKGRFAGMRSYRNGVRSSVRKPPSTISSATARPTAGDCCSPWPEKPFANMKLRIPG